MNPTTGVVTLVILEEDMTMKTMRAIFSAAVLISLMACAGASQSGSPAGIPKVVAVVNGLPVTEEAMKKEASADLSNLDMKKAQALVGFQREEHSILERALTNVIDGRIVDAEAKKRNMPVQTLIQTEVDSKVVPPNEAEVNAFYEANKGRINVQGDEALRQIRSYLRQQKRDSLYEAFITRLRTDYKVATYLDPLRTEVKTEGFPAKGPANAPVTIVEFSDFECPFCAQVFPTLQLIEARYGDKVRVIFRQFPLNQIHPRAQKAAEASLCANEQKKFWDLHDSMFQDNRNLEILDLKKKAAGLKLDSQAFDACLDSSKYAPAVQKDISEGVRVGVTGTPTLFINGRYFNGAQPYNELAKVIDEELQRKK